MVQNIKMFLEDAKKLNNILITAIDKNYYQYLSQLPKSSSLVIHELSYRLKVQVVNQC